MHKVVEFCVDAHEIVTTESDNYKLELNRNNHVTPTLYLNMMDMLHKVLKVIYTKNNSYKQ